MSRQLRIRVVGLLVVVLSGVAALGVIIPACGFEAPNLTGQSSDGGLLFDAPPDAFIADAAPCSSGMLTKTCIAGTVIRECTVVGQFPQETICEWGCTDSPAHCNALVPSGGAVASADLDRPAAMAAGLQKRTFQSITQPGSINTDTGAINIGLDSRQSGFGVKNGIDFKIINGVGIFRAIEFEFRGLQDIRVTGNNALALVAIDKLTINDGTQFDLRGTCTGRTAGPGGKQGGDNDAAGAGTGAGGAGDNGGGLCTGGGGAGNSENGNQGGGKANAGGTFANATIMVLTGGAGGGGGGTSGGGDGGGGGGAIQLISNGPIIMSAGTLQTVGINAGGCGGKTGTCGGGGGAGGAILIEGRTFDLGGGFLAANGGGGGGGSGGQSGEQAQTTNRANGGNGVSNGSDQSGDGGDGGDDGAGAAPGTVRQSRGGGGGGGVGWIRINTKSGSIGQSGGTLITPDPPSASTGTVIVQ